MRAPRDRDKLDALRAELQRIVLAPIFDVCAFAGVVHALTEELVAHREERNVRL